MLEAADPAAALRGKFAGRVAEFQDLPGRLFVASIGKASILMAREAFMHLMGAGVMIDAGFATAQPEFANVADLPMFEIHPCDHPFPTARNVAASESLVAWLEQLGPDDTLILLLSGGGSAHLCLPAGDLSLQHLVDATRLLQERGATIAELNAVRKHCERLKGGRLALAARCRRIEAFILSDVIGDDLSVISSGPVSPDPSTFADALDVLDRMKLRAALPRIVQHLSAGQAKSSGDAGSIIETPKPGDERLEHVRTQIIASNRLVLSALQGWAGLRGFRVMGCQPNMIGEAADIGRKLAGQCRLLGADRSKAPMMWMIGGEPTVTVQGETSHAAQATSETGIGGPSQELALSAAAHIANLPNVAVVTISTDGRDGPTNAAGGFVTGHTWDAIRRAGCDAGDALRRHDSHTALAASRSLVVTGPTGTNLNHIAVAMVYASS